MFLFREVRPIAIGQPPNCNSAALICTTWCRRANHGTVWASTPTAGCRYPSKMTYAWLRLNCLAVIKLEIKQQN